MHFGRVENLAPIDWTLPADDPATDRLLSSLAPSTAPPKLYIGCPVWGDKGYVGKVYPPKTKATDYLTEYCRQFNTIEVNSSHYTFPNRSQIMKWKMAATPGFKFCPKFHQSISHRRGLDNNTELVNDYLAAVYDLGEHLGPAFIQFPESFHPRRADELYRFLEGLPIDFEIAVEVRHEEWFVNPQVRERYFKTLQDLGKIAVITDVSGRRDVLHQALTSGTAFVRFTGNDLHPSDYTRIDDWIERLIQWIDKGLKNIYFFQHEPTKHLTGDLAIYMIQKMKEQIPNLDIKAPTLYNVTAQKGLFD